MWEPYIASVLEHVDDQFVVSQYEGVAFFLLASIGAASTMLSFLGLIFGASAGVAYGVVRLSQQQRRLSQGAAQGRRCLQGQPVPGYSHVQFGRDHYYRPERLREENSSGSNTAGADGVWRRRQFQQEDSGG
jgi:hypothetical protein